MDYISEIRAFFDWIQFNSIPADAQALWHLLMHLNNKCAVKINDTWYWRVEFAVSNTTLLSFLRFSRQQLDRMRNLLVQVGRIEYRKGKGNQSGTYKLIPFDAHNVTQIVTQLETQTDTQVWTQTGHKSSTLNNYNNTSYGNFNLFSGGDGESAPVSRPEGQSGFLADLNTYFGITEDLKREIMGFTQEIFRRYVGRKPTEHDATCMFLHVYDSKQDAHGRWVIEFPERKRELAEYVFKQAASNGNVSWSYIEGIYANLLRRGIASLDDAEQYDFEREELRNG